MKKQKIIFGHDSKLSEKAISRITEILTDEGISTTIEFDFVKEHEIIDYGDE